MSREVASQLNQNTYEETMRRFINACPVIKELLEPATRITEGMYGELRVRRDWSYMNTKFWSPGMLLVGDAACFVDPIFSSGVHLGTYGALLAARSINTCLKSGDTIGEDRSLTEFERRYRREYSNWYQFVMGFYDLHQDKESYYFNARKILNTEERANDAFIRLCSGVSNTGEPLYENATEFMNDRTWAGDALDKIINEEKLDAHLPMVKEKLGAEKFEKLPAPILESSFNMITQSLIGPQALPQTPLYQDGLIVSTDGFHWAAAN
jgi:FAD-dependent halogenase